MEFFPTFKSLAEALSSVAAVVFNSVPRAGRQGDSVLGEFAGTSLMGCVGLLKRCL
jgi:hypothetical protein